MLVCRGRSLNSLFQTEDEVRADGAEITLKRSQSLINQIKINNFMK